MGMWKMEEYSVDQITNDIESKKIKVPKYQRGAIWNKSQKEKLIDSMINGFPFGSILLYKTGENSMQIIDGLQRSTTIIEFVKNPAQFFNTDNFEEELLIKIIKKLGVLSSEKELRTKIEDIIKTWIVTRHKNMLDIQRMQYSKLVDAIIEEFPTAAENKKELEELLAEILCKFQDTCNNISKIQIPALVYEGEESLLPEIFERINSQGAKLTKQQIYAATWATDTVKLSSSNFEDVLKYNRERYENMLNENMELDNYNGLDYIRNREVNIFELVFGFGKMISRKYPYLFECDNDDDVKVESIGFNLINACLVQKSSEMAKLNSNLKKYIGLEEEEIEEFLVKILDCIEYVDKKLSRGIKFKSNIRSNSKIKPLHSEMQIVSIIATIFIMRHANFEVNDKGNILNIKIDPKNYNQKWSDKKDVFTKNILKIYTIDVLGQKWKGSGDKKLDNIVMDTYYYCREISWPEFEQNLDLFFLNINNERNERKSIALPKEQEKLLLNLVYSNIFTAGDQNGDTNFDIEHLATKNLMKEKINNYGEDFRLPISSIGNLCLLPEYDNRVKKDKTIYQDENYLSKINISSVEDKYTFTNKEDMEWLLQEGLNEKEFKQKYFDFLNLRFSRMKEKIKSSLFQN